MINAMTTTRITSILTLLVLGLAGVAIAQAPATQPATEVPPAATQPADVDEVYEARVIQVVNRADYQLVDEQGEPGEWQPAKVNDLLPQGTRVRTLLRSRLTLAFGPDVVTVIEPMTIASIDQFYRAGDTKRVRISMGHGSIRAGAAETTLRSDMTIDTPTATLSKRGTMDFGIQYFPPTEHGSPGRFRIYLAREGLVEALNKMTDESRAILPGQYITQAMRRWIDTLSEDRWVPVVDTWAMTDAEALFNMLNDSGLSVVEPGGGSEIYKLAGRDVGKLAALINAQRTGFRPIVPSISPPGQTVFVRPEGNFGTGAGANSAARIINRGRKGN